MCLIPDLLGDGQLGQRPINNVIRCSCEGPLEWKQARVQSQRRRIRRSVIRLHRSLFSNFASGISTSLVLSLGMFLLFFTSETKLFDRNHCLKTCLCSHETLHELCLPSWVFTLSHASLSYILQTQKLLIDGAAKETKQPPSSWQRDWINHHSVLKVG